MVRGHHTWASGLVLALAVGAGFAGCQRAAAPVGAAPVRFIDQLPPGRQQDIYTTIDGVTKPVLPPFRTEDRFTLSSPPPRSQLVFAVGLRPVDLPADVRFEVLLQPAVGVPVTLYEKELRDKGWRDERVDLADRDLRGATLILRHTRLDASGKGPHGVWGNPMLLPATEPQRPALILISIDTLRADFTGPYGYRNAGTFALDRLAREGTLYEQAYSPSTWTVPSHASLFYGMHLPESPTTMRESKRIPPDSLAAARPLATILRAAGYLTAGITGGGFLDWPFDFPRGFDSYFAFQHASEAECLPDRFDGETVFSRAKDWLRANHQRPFFLFVHTYDVHDRCPFTSVDTPAFGSWPKLSAERHQELLEYYSRLIADTDRRIASLLDVVDELGLRDSTLLMLVSDHGEAYSEHGVRGHGCDMKPYEELSRVPLLLRFPGRVPAGVRVATPTSLINVAPTALALLGIPLEPWMEGHPLPGLGLAAVAGDDQPVFVHCGDALMVRRGSFNLITSNGGLYHDEIYDLAEDAGERHPLADHDAVHAQLRADAGQFWKRAVGLSTTPAEVTQQLDEATKERLRALGYVH